MIVTCPNCGARYRLSDAVVAQGKRLKCAACAHRWVPEPPEDDVAAIAPVAPPEVPPPEPEAAPETARFETPPEAAPAASVPETDGGGAPEPEAEPDEARSAVVPTIVALVLGLALAIAAIGLWVGRIDASQVPVVGPSLARLAPPPAAVKVTVFGKVTALPSGGRVLEVSGTIANPGKAAVPVPALKASLSGPGGAARRWIIAPPAAMLPAGQSVYFSSTVTGFPGDARTLSVTPEQ